MKHRFKPMDAHIDEPDAKQIGLTYASQNFKIGFFPGDGEQ